MNAPADALPSDPNYAARIRASFGRQKAMALIGASLTSVTPGATCVAAPGGGVSRQGYSRAESGTEDIG